MIFSWGTLWMCNIKLLPSWCPVRLLFSLDHLVNENQSSPGCLIRCYCWCLHKYVSIDHGYRGLSTNWMHAGFSRGSRSLLPSSLSHQQLWLEEARLSNEPNDIGDIIKEQSLSARYVQKPFHRLGLNASNCSCVDFHTLETHTDHNFSGNIRTMEYNTTVR